MTVGQKLLCKAAVVLALGAGALVTAPAPAAAAAMDHCGPNPACDDLSACELLDCPNPNCPEVQCIYDPGCVGGLYHVFCGGST